jgi:hypothetical protein
VSIGKNDGAKNAQLRLQNNPLTTISAAPLEESWAAEYYALFMEMGTGKTKVAIDNMAVLFEAGKITAVLVVAPKGVYDNWAKSEIQTHLPERIERHVMRWRPVKTQTYETELKDFILANTPLTLKIFVMNIEAFSTPRGAGIAKRFSSIIPTTWLSWTRARQSKTAKPLEPRTL